MMKTESVKTLWKLLRINEVLINNNNAVITHKLTHACSVNGNANN